MTSSAPRERISSPGPACITSAQKYGALFRPTPELDERQATGQNWYPLNHFRPLVDWPLDAAAEEEFNQWIQGALFQMASLLLHEQRGHLSHINAIGELCAQFRRGILAMIRSMGAEAAIKTVEAYHRLYPAAAESCWYPAVFEQLDSPEWQQLYVNAEHDGNVGVITISREAYNYDVDAELNRAIDWLKAAGIAKVILTGDFHLATQMVGADTSEFFPALNDVAGGTPSGGHLGGDRQAAARRVPSVGRLRQRQTVPGRFPGAAPALPLPGRRRGRGRWACRR